MARLSSNQKPTFFWQGILIVLPVVVLGAVGLFSLRQDKILAQHEATARAQAIADDLLPRIWNELTGTNNASRIQSLRFQIDSAGQLLFPPPFAPVPEPRSLTELPPDNAKAVANYNDAVLLAQQGKFQEAADVFEAIVENFPRAIGDTGLELGPLAQWKLLELQNLTTNHIATKHVITPDSFWSNAVYHPTALTPYFLQLAPEHDRKVRETWQLLWGWHELSRELYTATRQHFGGETSLAAPLRSVERKEGALGLATNLAPNILIPRFFWFETSEIWNKATPVGAGKNQLDIWIEHPHWLAVRYDEFPTTAAEGNLRAVPEPQRPLEKGFDRWSAGSNNIITHENTMTLDFTGRAGHSNYRPTKFWFVCRAETEIGSQITALVNATQIPEYFGIGFELAGRTVNWDAPDLRVWRDVHYNNPRSGGIVKREYSSELASNILASATQSEAGANPLKVNVYLTSPTTLFHNQRTRSFWFGSLIAVSAVTALMGLLTAWRVFNRQQQLSEMKSNFVSSVSHELRAPIASVRLMAESLERGKISGEQKQSEYFRFIVQECRRLTSLIENVLDFSRIEQGRKQYEFEPTDLVALTEQTVKLMETYAAERQIKLVATIPNSQLSTLNSQPVVDGKAIQQALVNLIDNAVKHSPKGGTVTVGMEVGGQRSEVGGQRPEAADAADHASRITHHAASINSQPSTINLSVSDHGEGIPPEEHEKIFERFYRLGSELRRETQGVGIGLSIVKHIVAAHGGKVHVRSAIGQGSRFTIELPIKN